MPFYTVAWKEKATITRSVNVEADNKDTAIDLVRSGDASKKEIVGDVEISDYFNFKAELLED